MILRQELHDFFEKNKLPEAVLQRLELVLEELFINTIVHGAPTEKKARHWVELSLQSCDQQIKMCLIDNGVAFDPASRPDPDTSLELEQRQLGGLGIYFVKKLMDPVTYERSADGCNILRMSYLLE